MNMLYYRIDMMFKYGNYKAEIVVIILFDGHD